MTSRVTTVLMVVMTACGVGFEPPEPSRSLPYEAAADAQVLLDAPTPVSSGIIATADEALVNLPVTPSARATMPAQREKSPGSELVPEAQRTQLVFDFSNGRLVARLEGNTFVDHHHPQVGVSAPGCHH